MKTKVKWLLIAVFLGLNTFAIVWRVRMRNSESRVINDSPPKAVAKETLHHFGRQVTGTMYTHPFPFRNEGGKILELGLMTPQNHRATGFILGGGVFVAPGEERELMVQLSFLQRLGPVREEVTLATNDPANPVLKFTLEGEVVWPVTLDRDRLDLGLISPTNSIESKLTVVVPEGSALKFTGTKTSADFVTVNLDEDQASKTYRLTVKLRGPFPPGELKGWVHLLCDEVPGGLAAAIAITARVLGDSQNLPAGAEFHAFRAGRRLRQKGPTLEGDKFDSFEWRGAPAIAIVWSSWAESCEAEFRELNQLQTRYGEDSLGIFGISVDRDVPAASSFVKQQQLDWPNVYYPAEEELQLMNQFIDRYQITALPVVVLLNAEANVVTASSRTRDITERLAELMK
jgi:thiol-disulfide isomerase/thioredoxin